MLMINKKQLKDYETVAGVILILSFILSRIQEVLMTIGFRVFNNDEKTTYKDTKRYHLQNQKMDEKQRSYWNRKPYDFGRKHNEE